MAFIVRDEIEAYAAAHTTQPEPLLAELAEETRATLARPQMLTGTIEGRLLELLVHTSGARRVLEIGTYSGHSALAMAAALPEGGRIDTVEEMPDQWFGYEAADLVVLGTGNPSADFVAIETARILTL